MSGGARDPAPAAGAAAPARTPYVRLAVMMFLQYAIWGAWLPLLWPFLHGHRGFSPSAIGDMFAVGAVGALLAPFVAGQIADRHFATEKFLAVSHLLGAALVWQLSWITEYWQFLVFSLLYSLIYSPTLPLTNSLAFHHLADRDRDFGRVRVFGTIGWICVGIGIGQWLLYRHSPAGVDAEALQAAQAAGMADAFRLSAILGAAMGLFSFLLPHTPPCAGERRSAVMEALSEVKRRPLLVLFLLAVPISCIHQFYFVHTAAFLGRYQSAAAETINLVFGVGGGGLMTVGQMSEILVLALIPLVAKQVSRKALLATGVVAYAARMVLFRAVDDLPLPPTVTLLLGVALHGFCFGCFIFVAFMIVDEETTSDVRASAQSLFNLVIIGVGIIAGSKVAGWVAEWATVPGPGSDGQMAEQLDYARLFAVPMWAALACLVVLLAFYPGGRRRGLPARGDA